MESPIKVTAPAKSARPKIQPLARQSAEPSVARSMSSAAWALRDLLTGFELLNAM
jgi:hypothetical protein